MTINLLVNTSLKRNTIQVHMQSGLYFLPIAIPAILRITG